MNNSKLLTTAGKASILFIVFAFSTLCFAQDSDKVAKELDSVALKMFNDVNERNYDGIMDMSYPKLFEFVPREVMVNVFKSMFEGNDEFTVDIPKLIPEYEISEVFKVEKDSAEFAFINYDLKMSMTFHDIAEEGFDEEGKEMMVDMMKMQGMEAEFVSDNTIDVIMPNRMTIMVNDKLTNGNWAMINYDTNSPLFYQILSAPIVEKAKDYYQDLLIEHKKKD